MGLGLDGEEVYAGETRSARRGRLASARKEVDVSGSKGGKLKRQHTFVVCKTVGVPQRAMTPLGTEEKLFGDGSRRSGLRDRGGHQRGRGKGRARVKDFLVVNHHVVLVEDFVGVC